jgi:hypothetical protein
MWQTTLWARRGGKDSRQPRKSLGVPQIEVRAVGRAITIEIAARPSGACIEAMIVPGIEVQTIDTTIQIGVSEARPREFA